MNYRASLPNIFPLSSVTSRVHTNSSHGIVAMVPRYVFGCYNTILNCNRILTFALCVLHFLANILLFVALWFLSGVNILKF